VLLLLLLASLTSDAAIFRSSSNATAVVWGPSPRLSRPVAGSKASQDELAGYKKNMLHIH